MTTTGFRDASSSCLWVSFLPILLCNSVSLFSLENPNMNKDFFFLFFLSLLLHFRVSSHGRWWSQIIWWSLFRGKNCLEINFFFWESKWNKNHQFFEETIHVRLVFYDSLPRFHENLRIRSHIKSLNVKDESKSSWIGDTVTDILAYFLL